MVVVPIIPMIVGHSPCGLPMVTTVKNSVGSNSLLHIYFSNSCLCAATGTAHPEKTDELS
jgi:hypothetical protein